MSVHIVDDEKRRDRLRHVALHLAPRRSQHDFTLRSNRRSSPLDGRLVIGFPSPSAAKSLTFTKDGPTAAIRWETEADGKRITERRKARNGPR